MDLKGNGSGVVAFEKTTGKIRYRFSDELASYASPIVTNINGRRTGLVFARGGLIAFDLATGKQDFHFPWRSKELESVNASNPVVVGDMYTCFRFWADLLDEGVYVNAVVPPAVPRGQSLMRTSYMATHTDEDLDQILEAFRRVGLKHGVIEPGGRPGRLVGRHGDAPGNAMPPELERSELDDEDE